jgi:hypothetical protein
LYRSTTRFSSTTSGGTYSSATPAVAEVNASTGVVTGVSVGTSIINYSVTTTGGCVNTASSNSNRRTNKIKQYREQTPFVSAQLRKGHQGGN